MQRAREMSGLRSNRIAIRTRYFDDFVAKHVDGSAPCQVVSLGAGMDMRPYRLECMTSQVRWYEIDTEDVIAAKETRLNGVQPAPCSRAACVVRIGRSLLCDEWVEELGQSGFDAKDTTTIWIMEGIVYYFEENDVRELFRKVHALSSAGSVFCASVLKSAPRNKSGPAFRSYIPDAERFVRQCGFELLAADFYGGPAANYGRCETERKAGTYYVSGRKLSI